jgi:DNA-binding response OmpR family regulator
VYFIMATALALLVSADPVTIDQVSHALQELSISPDVCQEVPASIHLLNRLKFDAVIVDLQLGEQSGLILDEVRLSPSNRTAVTFAISGSDAEGTPFRKKSEFVFERPLSAQSIRNTLKPAYGLILRERRRYFRCPISIPVTILRQSMPEVRCYSVNISEGGMAVSTLVPLIAGEDVQVQVTLPDHKGPFLAESKICWSKTGRLGVRFVFLSQEHKSELQGWLSQKLEETLPKFVARKFQSKVLLVDDSKFLRMATELALSKAGFDVSTAADGEEALQVANDKLPDIILLDMMLPKISGPDVLKALKGKPATMDIPVVVLTSLPQRNEKKLLHEGAAAYFEKSTLELDKSSDRLVATVETVLDRAHHQESRHLRLQALAETNKAADD